MKSSNEDNNINNFSYENSDLKKFFLFILRNKYSILICYLITLIPSYFLAKNISTPKRNLGQVNIYFKKDISDDSKKEYLIENILNIDPYKELKFIKNEATIKNIFKELNTSNNYKYNEFKNQLLLRLLDENNINIQYRDFNTENIKKVLDLIIDKYTKRSRENRKIKTSALIKKLDFQINESKITKNNIIDLISKIPNKSDSDKLISNLREEFKKLSSTDTLSLIEKKLILESIPDNSFNYIKYENIVSFKTYKIKALSIIYLFFIFLSLFIVFLKEQYFGPYESKELIEKFLKLKFIGDLSSKNLSKYDEVLCLSNKISNNIFESNEIEKVVLVKNNNAVSYNELKNLKEKLSYLDNQVLGWFIIN